MFPITKIKHKKFTMFNHDLLIDLNFIDSVFFVKSKDRHNFIFRNTNNKSVEIIVNDNIKFKNKKLSVPSGFDEDILYILIYLGMKFKEKYKLEHFPRGILFTYTDIKNLLLETKDFSTNNDNIDLSLLRLRHTVYNIKESFLKRDGSKLCTEDFDRALSEKLITDKEYEDFYNNLDGVPDHIIAKLSTINPVAKVNIKSSINLLNELTEIEIKQISKSGITSFVESNIVNDFVSNLHGSINKFFYVKFNDSIYNNIVGKVTISRSLFYLLSLENIERTILNLAYLNQGKYIFTERKTKINVGSKNNQDSTEEVYFVDKFHKTNYINQNEVVLGLFTILNKIPLDTSLNNLTRNYNKILKSLDYLKDNGYIMDYLFFDDRPRTNLKFKIIFFEHQNSYNKIGKYYDSRFSDHTEISSNPLLTEKQLLELTKNNLLYDNQLFNLGGPLLIHNELDESENEENISNGLDLFSDHGIDCQSNEEILLISIESLKRLFNKIFHIDLSVTTLSKINSKLKPLIKADAFYDDKKLPKHKHEYFLDFINYSFTSSLKVSIRNPEGLFCSYLNNINEKLEEYLYIVAQGVILDNNKKTTLELELKKDDIDNVVSEDVFSLNYVNDLKKVIKLQKVLNIKDLDFTVSKFLTSNKKLLDAGFTPELIFYVIEARLLEKLDFTKIPMVCILLFSKLNI